MTSNEHLATSDHTSGLERRRLTVVFDRRVTDAEKQAWQSRGGEEAVLHSELAGLVNWLLELSQDDISRLIRHPPKRTVIANHEAMQAGNPVAEWLVEYCIPDVTAWSQIGDGRKIHEQGVEVRYEKADERLYPNYLTWCQRHNRTPCTLRRFRENVIDTLRTLKKNAVEIRRKQGQGIQGVRLRREWEPVLSDQCWLDMSLCH